MVVLAGCVFVLLGLSLLRMAESEMVMTHNAVKETQAFHLAEAGVAKFIANAYDGEVGNVESTSLGDGTYQVTAHCDGSPQYAISTGTVGNAQKRIKVEVSFLSPPYEHAIYGCNASGQEWTLELRGNSGSDSGPQDDWSWGDWMRWFLHGGGGDDED